MKTLEHLLANNRAWAAGRTREDPEFFRRLAALQRPRYLWIGCSDSRVPANQIVGLDPGDVFVHRNVANIVVHSDLNLLSVLQFGIDVLGVRDVIVCGHYGCGGIHAALGQQPLGLVDNWLRHLKDIAQKHAGLLEAIAEPAPRAARLAELNVLEQAWNVCHTTIAQDAWRRGQPLSVHGWIYGIDDGLIRDLGFCVTSSDEITPLFRMALAAEAER